jgi:hypothetical protein
MAGQRAESDFSTTLMNASAASAHTEASILPTFRASDRRPMSNFQLLEDKTAGHSVIGISSSLRTSFEKCRAVPMNRRNAKVAEFGHHAKGLCELDVLVVHFFDESCEFIIAESGLKCSQFASAMRSPIVAFREVPELSHNRRMSAPRAANSDCKRLILDCFCISVADSSFFGHGGAASATRANLPERNPPRPWNVHTVPADRVAIRPQRGQHM